MSELFLDAAFAIALASPSDKFHVVAKSLSNQIEAMQFKLVTTRAVIFEIGNSLARQRYRHSGVELLASLAGDPRIEITPLDELYYRQAHALYAARPDKEWGLTDCLSFVVMGERGMTKALTCDEHFEQAGFVALLLHPDAI